MKFPWFKKKQEKRNYAVADSWQTKIGQPIYTSWTIEKAVKEGYRANGWVYRAVNLITKAAASVPWEVVNEDGESLPKHHISVLLDRPNPHISRQDLFELIISWLELSGNSYLKKVHVGERTAELWPISPDRLHPVPTKDISEWLAGYALDESPRVAYEPQDVIHHKFFNPANPLLGIAPLEAAARTVDCDNEQQDFNKAAMQNRGVVDGVMTFEREFEDQKDADVVADSLNERHAGPKNARRIAVVGSNAKYHRTSLTPVEMDFGVSRKYNRDEIFIIFGVPPQYAGAQESSTYNNYSTSELIFWLSTVIPLLDDLADTFNHSFHNELNPGEKIQYDISNVSVLRAALFTKSETAEKLFKMGVPFKQLNAVFKFGFSEFPGWEDSLPSQSIPTETPVKRKLLTLIEKRSVGDEQKEIDETAENIMKPVFEELFEKQRKAIFADIEKTGGGNVTEIIEDSSDDWEKTLTGFYLTIGAKFGSDITVEKRQAEDEITALLEEYLEEEKLILTEVSFISDTTVSLILQQMEEGLDQGWATKDLQQAIIDVGTFSPARALMLARTITGNAANLGQWKSAQLSGATHKTWATAGFEVRDSHKKMNGKTVKIDEDFTVGKEKARYPLDNRLSPGNRVNCRCTLTYEVEG
jgi:HK97 family phage portal protein